jgi:putative spermidine/putrescine transport system permease protein
MATPLEGLANQANKLDYVRRRNPGCLRNVIFIVPVVFLILFFVFPIGQMLLYSFYSYHHSKLMIREFTLANWLAVFEDPYLRGVLLRTLRLSFISTVISVALAYPIAYRMRQAAGFEKMLLSLIVLSPLTISLVILGYAFIVILAPNTGLLNNAIKALGGTPLSVMYTELGVLVGLVYPDMMFMVLSLHAVMENIEESTLRAARTLGANPIQIFLRVILPLSVPGLVSGSLIHFTVSTSSFVMPLLLGGRQTPVLSMYAYDMATFVLNWPSASAIAGTLLFITSCVVIIYTSWIFSIEKRLGSRQ